MTRLRIPGLIDVLRVDDPAEIAALADDARLDRAYVARGPLMNRLIASRIRKILTLDGAPLPPVAPRGAARPTPGQAALEMRLNAIAAAPRAGRRRRSSIRRRACSIRSCLSAGL
jgi:hypothetical protein